MANKKSINLLLRTTLLLTIPLLLFLMQKKAVAIKLFTESKEERRRIYKDSLPHSSLEKRMAWLEKEIPKRIPEIIKEIEKKKTPISIVVYKKERVVELWKRGKTNKKLKTYKMTAFSGGLGPKNQQGDRQIPEGVYRASVLNPNSRYYLSIGVNYPNSNDRKRGQQSKINDLGGDIFIHGRSVTIGCVPIGDHYIEELFYIVGTVGLLNSRVVIAPSRLPLPALKDLGLNEKDKLLSEKYSQLSAELTKY